MKLRDRVEKSYNKCPSLLPLHVEKEYERNEQGVKFMLKLVSNIAHKPQAHGITEYKVLIYAYERTLLKDLTKKVYL